MVFRKRKAAKEEAERAIAEQAIVEKIVSPLPPAPIPPAPIPQVEPAQPVAPVEQTQELWSLQDFPTETQTVIVNKQTQEKLDVMGALVKILNTLEEF